MKNLIFFALLLVFLFFNTLSAQSNLLNAKVPQEVGQMNEQQIDAENVTPVEYGYVDDRDILWSKTIWETIDLDERINFPYYYPTINNGYLSSNRKSLFRVLMDGIIEGNITEVYSTDYFNDKLTYEDLQEVLELRRLSPEGISKQNAGENVTEDDYDIYKIESDKGIQY